MDEHRLRELVEQVRNGVLFRSEAYLHCREPMLASARAGYAQDIRAITCNQHPAPRMSASLKIDVGRQNFYRNNAKRLLRNTFMLHVSPIEALGYLVHFLNAFQGRSMLPKLTQLRLALLAFASALLPTCAAAAPCRDIESQFAGKSVATPGVIELLKNVPDDAKWIDLPKAIQEGLEHAAEVRLANYRSHWGRDALQAKEEALLECRTAAMSASVGRLLSLKLRAEGPPVNLDDVQDRQLKDALVRFYLVDIASERAGLMYPGHAYPNLDWDGKSPFDSVWLPDDHASRDIARYAASVVVALRAIPGAELSASDRALKERALYFARGSASFVNTPCALSGNANDVIAGYRPEHARPVTYLDDEDVAAEVNAIYLPGMLPRWLDVGTMNSAIDYELCNWDVAPDSHDAVAPTGAHEVARIIPMLQRWWEQRTQQQDHAAFTFYTPAERALVWDNFTARQLTNNDGSVTLESFSAEVETVRINKVAHYSALAKQAVNAVFVDDSILTPSQRAQVLAALELNTNIAHLPEIIGSTLNTAQGTTTGPAAKLWNATYSARVLKIGGLEGGHFRELDAQQASVMLKQVHAWLAARYRDYPVDLTSIFAGVPLVATDSASPETNAVGEIRFGLGVRRPLYEQYSQMIHESRHAVMAYSRFHALDASKLMPDFGIALEGSAVAAEDLLLPEFFASIEPDATTRALYELSMGIRDARILATTEATLKRYTRTKASVVRDEGSPVDTREAARRIANRYGLDGALAETLDLRSHADTQYLQYLFGGAMIKDDLKFLEVAIDPVGKTRLDPYILFECNLNSPSRDLQYVNALRSCVAEARAHKAMASQ